MLVLEGPVVFSFFSITGRGIDLDYCDIEWFALETKRDHSVVFEIASKYCSAALNKPANLGNSAVATGLEKVSFHSSP